MSADRVLIPLPGIGTLELTREEYEARLRPVGGPQHDPAPADSEPLVNAGALAKALNLPKSWIYELARSKRIPCVRSGKHVRFDRAAVLAVLRATAPEADSRR